MKFSEAMLKGYEMVGGRQCKNVFHRGNPFDPDSVCVLGAVSLGDHGNALGGHIGWSFSAAFKCKWGVYPANLNDEGMPWEHIYGMAVAAGL